jgi:hypothetical protein
MPGLPEVSLITSWHGGASPPAPPPAGAAHRDSPPPADPPTGLTHALRNGHGLLDLYFLSHTDLNWYMQVADRKRKWKEKEKNCPLCFAASLERPEIERIANALLDVFIDAYVGRLIGPRPRFAALATYWPLICDVDPELRSLSIKALQNTLVLARCLGCRHVEIVGGAAFSPEDGDSGT